MATVKKPLEKDIQRVILEWLKLRGITAWRQNAGTIYTKGRRIDLGPPGCSDIIGYMPDGRFLAIEVKVPGEEPTVSQYAFLCKVAAAGGVAHWTDALDDTFMSIIEGGLADGKA